MLRKFVRAFWMVLAILFLVEAWLWAHLEPIVARVVALLPWEGMKAALTRLIARLSPQATLVVFAVPFVLLMPLKFLEVWLIVHRQWIGAVIVLVLAKLVGLGIIAFIFEVTKEKLLRMGWFRRTYEWFIWVRERAHQKVEPVARRLRKWRHILRLYQSGRFIAQLARVRRRMRVAVES
jgi:hypothetical protein